jgi:hypothetical protein
MSNTYVRKSNLREFVNALLFEKEDVHGKRNTDVPYGIYDRPIVSEPGLPPGPADDFDSTFPDDVPVTPAEQMATQLTSDRPPIEDDEFIPGNPDELGRAADVIAKQVPQDQIEKFYRALHRLLDQTVELHNEPETAEAKVKTDEDEPEATPPVEPKGKKKIKEEGVRRRIRHIIQEISDDWREEEEYEEFRKGYQISGGDPTDLEDEPPVPAGPEGMSLEDIASETGHSGPSGARQEIERIVSRSGYMGEKMPAGDLDTLRTVAVGEFIDGLLSGGYIDEADTVELQQAPQEVEALDSFRFFFTQAFVLPAYQEVLKGAKKRVRDEIAKMGLPKQMHQTVLHQAMGETPKNMGKLVKKLYTVSAAQNLPPEQVEKMKAALESGLGNLIKSAEPADNLLDVAQARWGRTNDAKKQSVMQQALQSTSDYQEDLAKITDEEA